MSYFLNHVVLATADSKCGIIIHLLDLAIRANTITRIIKYFKDLGRMGRICNCAVVGVVIQRVLVLGWHREGVLAPPNTPHPVEPPPT